MFNYYPLSLAALTHDKRYVACSGSTSEIDIVDICTMKIVTTLRGHTDWVTAINSTELNGSPLLMSGSRDGLVHFWSMQAGEEVPLRTVCLDEGVHPIAIALSPNKHTFMIVTPKEWLVSISSSV